MDEQRIEAALRTQPPDEPEYRGDIAARLRERVIDAGRSDAPAPEVQVVALIPHRRRRLVAMCGAIAAAVALVVALAVVNRPDQQSPTTTPTTAPPTTQPTTTPSLAGRWVGATPPSVMTPTPSAPAFVVFAAESVALEHLSGGAIVNDFTSQFTVNADGQLRLTLVSQEASCAPGATGDYRWTTSPKGTVLTLTAISDECPKRAAALAGDWTHIGCPTRGQDCLGELEAGRHASVSFDPFGDSSYGEVEYDITDGWSSTDDQKDRLTLRAPGVENAAVHGLYFFADVVAAANDCTGTATAAVDATAIAGQLSSTPGLNVSMSEMTVDGFPARVLDLSSAASLPCAGRQPLLASSPDGVTSWSLDIGREQSMRLVLVDLPAHRTMAVAIITDRADQYQQLLDAAMSVVDSLTLSTTS